MEINYDKDADAVYIELCEGEFSKNKKIDDLTIFDLDANGNLLGIEILDASRRIHNLSEVKVNNALKVK